MKVTALKLAGVKLLEPQVYQDSRGWFYESYHYSRFLTEAGIHDTFLQDNHSRSAQNTLRGLHYQSRPGQAKLVRCTQGVIVDVAVDLRHGSSTYGKWLEVALSGAMALYIPVGFAHGFYATTDCEVEYKCSAHYNAETECSIAWDDPDIGIRWPSPHPVLSERDQKAESFAAFRARDPLFYFSG